MPIAKITLAKFLNPVFVETGTYHGAAIRDALSLGFETIYSTDNSKKCFNQISTRYATNQNVHLYNLNSPDFLAKILPSINEPITFWLDAHPPGYDLHPQNCPVYDELKAIKKYCKVPYIILIDDVRCFQAENRKSLLALASTLDHKHNINFVDGLPKRTNDILLVQQRMIRVV